MGTYVHERSRCTNAQCAEQELFLLCRMDPQQHQVQHLRHSTQGLENGRLLCRQLDCHSGNVQEGCRVLHSYFRRKAFLHWYTGEGMDEMEFTEAESNMND